MIRINPSSLIKLLLAMALCYSAHGWWSDRPVSHGPGAVAPNPPRQEAVRDGKPFSHKGYTIKPLAEFELKARVLSREDYYLDASAVLSPVDLALGWGPMSDESVLAEIEISQSGRFYYWRTDQFPIPRRHIELNSSNMHLIPATPAIEEQIKRVRFGQIVRLSGYLIEAQGPNNWRWRSSLSREDTGNGACEVIWIERFQIL